MSRPSSTSLPSICQPTNAYETLSKLEEMKRWVLATLLRKKKPALIPIVGIRVKGKHKNLEEEEDQAHNTKVYYLVVKYKDKVALE